MADAPTALDLLDRRNALPYNASLLSFRGVPGHDVYNLTAPFRISDTTCLTARVERRESERSHIRFFTERTTDEWVAVDAGDPPELQDPFTFSAEGQRYFGGVRVVCDSDTAKITGWSTVLLSGGAPDQLHPVFEGPAGMKDIRFVELDGRIGVLTRPQGKVGGRGTIGYTSVERLDMLQASHLQAAPLLGGQFAPGEWGGANEAHALSDGRIGVLGHVAYFDEHGHRHYYAMAFVLDTATGRPGPLQVIATRDDFPPGPAKRPDLSDVIFPGGLLRHRDGTATIYAGLSDARAGRATIPDPFTDT